MVLTEMIWDTQRRTLSLLHLSQCRKGLQGLWSVPFASPKQGPETVPSLYRAAGECPRATQGSLGTVEVGLGALSQEES